MISVVGGVYGEQCVSPSWDVVLGSGGRAAACLSTKCKTKLFTVLSNYAMAQFKGILAAYDFEFAPIIEDYGVTFRYLNPMILSEIIYDNDSVVVNPITITDKNVLRFGMINCQAKVHANRAVFDPQGGRELFSTIGSTADELVYVLNEAELRLVSGKTNIEECVEELIYLEKAVAVVVKLGPQGARLFLKTGEVYRIPAYRSKRVFKIGSGDIFSAAFSYYWMIREAPFHTAANMASKVVASYVETRDFCIPEDNELEKYFSTSVPIEAHSIYVAGPFFSVEQLWLVEEARRFFLASGLSVFSPFHDVGIGGDEVARRDIQGIEDCQAVFGIMNGNDPGTIFEIGYAVAKQKPVSVFSERTKTTDLTMMRGTGCKVFSDYSTAIYNAIWDSCG